MPAWLPFLASAASAPAGPQSSSPATTTLASLGLATLAALLAARLLRAFYNVARIAAGLRSVPLAPDHHPLLGHALGLLKGCYWDTMEAWWRAGRTESAPLVQMVIGHRRMVVAGSAEAAREVFQTKVRAFAKDLDFSFKPFLPILGTGLVTASGALWQSQRLLIAPALRVDVLEVVPGIAVRAAERLCAKLRAAVEKAERDGSSPPVVDMEEEFRLLTLQVIGEAILSLPPEECNAVFPELYLPVMEEANLRALRPWRALVPGTRAGAAYKRGIARLDDYITRLLRARWAARSKNSNNGNADGSSPVYTDILERMLASIAARGEAWSPALETQLCFDVKTFLLAGHETSAAMLTWTLYELCCGGGVDGGEGTEALAAVRAEAAAVLGVSGGGAPTPPAATVPTREDAETRMETSLACLKESLRKYTVVPVVTRVVAADGVSLCGVPVPRGTYVAMLAQAVHKGRWADPGAWRPSRFSPGGEYESFPESIRPFTYVPFIQGPRNCLGQYFALLEARIVLARVLGEFDFVKATPGVPRRHPAVIPTGPEGGMPMRVSVRGSGGK